MPFFGDNLRHLAVWRRCLIVVFFGKSASSKELHEKARFVLWNCSSGIHDNTKPFARVGRKAYWVSLRQPGRRNIHIDIYDPTFFPAVSGAGSSARQKDTIMPDFEMRSIGSCIKQLIPVVVLTLLFMVPSASNAELQLVLHNDVGTYPVPEIVRQAVKRPMDVSINENGDLVIRHRDVSLTVAYSPPDEFIEPQERLRIAQRQDCPAISGLSLKIGFPF